MKKIIQTTKVGFYDNTGDIRSPESFAFPACMVSLMEALGEDCPTEIIHAHNRDYKKRVLNDQFLAASGMAFGLLWHPEYCFSAMDLMQVTSHQETIARAFRWAGYDYELLERGKNEAGAKEKIVRSIDSGAPVLAFGLFDPPECALVSGYDDDGETLIGWSHFQDDAKLPREENGMFRLAGWQKEWWCFVVPGAKTRRTLSISEALSHGLEIMQKTQIEGYLAGQAAYEAWIKDVLGNEGDRARFDYHHSLLFNLAEARCWGGTFLRHEADAPRAGACFQAIHDLCWKADAVTGGTAPEGWTCLADQAKREELAAVLREIQAQDVQAMACLREEL